MKRSRLLGLLFAVVIIAPTALAGPPHAGAVVPGVNGKVVFSSTSDGDAEIFVMDADGQNQVQLTFNSSADTDPSWSPNGSQIAFVSDRDGDTEIFKMNADGSGQTALTSNTINDSEPVWSPTGSDIAYTSNPTDPAQTGWEIYRMDSQGAVHTRLTNNGERDYEPNWSPDGSSIAFTSKRNFFSYEIYRMAADGTGATALTSHSNSYTSSQPAYSPDGTKIAFVQNEPGDYEIYTMNSLNGGSITRLTTSTGFDLEPAWSPDGQRIVFSSQRDGDFEIFGMTANGVGQTQLTTDGADERDPDWQAGCDLTKWTGSWSGALTGAFVVPGFGSVNATGTTHAVFHVTADGRAEAFSIVKNFTVGGFSRPDVISRQTGRGTCTGVASGNGGTGGTSNQCESSSTGSGNLTTIPSTWTVYANTSNGCNYGSGNVTYTRNSGTPDTDGDATPDIIDQCPGTPPNTPVHADGCTLSNSDTDGQSDDVEAAAPNGGDGNSDGIQDSAQDNVSSFPSAGASGDYTTLVSPSGTTLSSVTALGLPVGHPAAGSFPLGSLSFEVHGVSVGGIVTLSYYMPADSNVTSFWKALGGSWTAFTWDGTTGAQISGNVATFTIQDGGRGDLDGIANGVIVDPVVASGPPTVSIGDASLVEGDLGGTRTLKFPVTLSQASSTPVTVQYSVTNESATGATMLTTGIDYKRPSVVKTLKFNVGAVGRTPIEQFVRIPINPDTSIEGDETFDITLSNPGGGYALGDASARGRIIDDDGAGTAARFSIGDVTIHEGSSGKRTASFTVALSKAVTEEVRVDYVIGVGTASCVKVTARTSLTGVDCNDFGGITKTLVFKPMANGSTPVMKVVNVTVYPDASTEDAESVPVTLSNARPANGSSSLPLSIGRSVGTATIVDDD